MKEINEAAIMWNKTKNPEYKEKWYKLIKRWSDGQKSRNIDTSVRWNINTRKVRPGKTYGSA
jgi:hypothetical protein